MRRARLDGLLASAAGCLLSSRGVFVGGGVCGFAGFDERDAEELQLAATECLDGMCFFATK